MEYERTSEGQIQAAMALRAGKVLLQYESFSKGLPPEEKYEATLAISLLQMMLTNCSELLKKKGLDKRGMTELENLKNASILDDPSKMGLEPSCILKCWPSERGLTYREIFQGLRNALSHPGAQKANRLPVTGFTSIESPTGTIDGYEFTQSSWVSASGHLRSLDYSILCKQMNDFASNHSVAGLDVVKNSDQRWQIVREGNPFIPVLCLRLDVKQLRTLTLTLSEVLSESLSQPLELQAV
ncbi:hypothetical protein [Limnohabitans sp. Rim8]|uniref:hypothetical protein n=1 Tax=Limnohabitans sp. Rim8 TaxID=1100718 RepID=UPI002622938A|nr:hypothetical protein [Limnohabitans sp. Rim8]